MSTLTNSEALPLTNCSASWMPIETAPKDKIEILVWSKRHGVNIGILHYKRPEMPSRKGGWFIPTHWMPLPIPPNAALVVSELVSLANAESIHPESKPNDHE